MGGETCNLTRRRGGGGFLSAIVLVSLRGCSLGADGSSNRRNGNVVLENCEERTDAVYVFLSLIWRIN